MKPMRNMVKKGMSIGERIGTLRKKLNISQYQLAKLMDVSRQAVSKWENGQSVPDSLKLIQLSEVLNTDVEYLTTGRITVPSRPPVVIKTVETVEKVVEKPVIQVVEKVVEKRIEVPIEKIVEIPVVKYRDRPVVKKVYRTQYVRNPIEYLVIGIGCFLLGLLAGFLL